jgi:hypothetical protein
VQSNFAVVSTIIMIVVTAVYTVGTFLLWATTRRYVELTGQMVEKLSQQVSHQIALSETASKNNITDAHRDLFMSILSSEKLFQTFTNEMPLGEAVVLKNMLATLLINHCSNIFTYYDRHIIDQDGFEGFKKDAAGMFALPLIRKRWQEVGTFHRDSFRHFVDQELIKK